MNGDDPFARMRATLEAIATRHPQDRSQNRSQSRKQPAAPSAGTMG